MTKNELANLKNLVDQFRRQAEVYRRASQDADSWVDREEADVRREDWTIAASGLERLIRSLGQQTDTTPEGK